MPNPFVDDGKLRTHVRRALAKIQASSVVLGAGELMADDFGNGYVGDGVTQQKNLVRLLNQGDLKKRAISITDYGAKADGGTTDNLPLFKLAHADAVSNARALYIPRGPGFYDISAPYIQPDGLPVIGDGSLASKVRMSNTGSAQGMATSCAWYHGTYTSLTSGAYQEAGYSFTATNRGVSVLTMVTASDAAIFTAGDVVLIDGPNAGYTQNMPNMANEVLSVDTGAGTVTLMHALDDDFSTGWTSSSTNHIRKLNTGAIPSVFTGVPGRLAIRGFLHGLHIETLQPNYQALHLAAYKSIFSDLRTVAKQAVCIAGNPVAWCTFVNPVMEFGLGAYEAAYSSHNNTLENMRAVRIGNTSSAVHVSVWVNGGEGGKHHDFINPTIEDNLPAGNGTNAVFVPGKGSSVLGGRIGSHRSGAVGMQLEDRAIIKGLRIDAAGSAARALTFVGTGSHAEDVSVVNSQSDSGIYLNPTTKSNVVRGARLGISGARVATDVIYDQGVDNYIDESCRTYGTLPRIGSLIATAFTGATTEQTVASQSGPDNQTAVNGFMPVGSGWRIRIRGTKTGSNGTATVRVKLVGTTAPVLATLTLPAAPGTGPWWVEGTLLCRASNVGWSHSFTGSDGTSLLNVGAALTTLGRTGTNGVTLTVQLANASDTVTVAEWVIEPLIAPSGLTGNFRVV